jgi:hypothetical protein
MNTFTFRLLIVLALRRQVGARTVTSAFILGRTEWQDNSSHSNTQSHIVLQYVTMCHRFKCMSIYEACYNQFSIKSAVRGSNAVG